MLKSLHDTAAKYFAGNNFMTPEILHTGFKGPYAYELSTGMGMSQRIIYGVSLRNRMTGESEEGKLFYTEKDARAFIRSLAWEG